MLFTSLSTRGAFRALMCAAAVVSVLGAATIASAKEAVLPDLPPIKATALSGGVLKVTLGKADIIDLPGKVSDIMVADPKVADVVAIQGDKLYIVGASLGDTNIIALDEQGNILKKINLHVHMDTVAIEAMLRDLFPQEKDVHVRMIGDQAALTGTVSTPSVAQKITRVVAAHMGEVQDKDSKNPNELIENLLDVRGEQQVMLRVRILEVSRDVLKELGVESSANDPNDTGSLLFGRTPPTNTNGLMGSVGVNGQTGLTEDPFGITSLIFDTGINGLGQLQFLLNALERDNLANVLAEPNLTSVSGEIAGFLAGGEFPVPVGRDREGNIIIEYKEFGVSLNFKPIVLSEDRISLQLDTEVSSLDPGQGITLADIQVPGLDVRRASTTVEINSGGSLMMAGLLKSENIKGMSGLPGIKNTPVLGDLISSKSFQRQETELVVIVTPYLVQPYADDKQAKPIASDVLDEPAAPPVPGAFAVPDKGKPVPLAEVPEKAVDGVVVVEPQEPEKQAAAPEETTDSKEVAEEEDAKEMPRLNTPLSTVFGDNMKKIYGDRVREIPKDQAYGYMID
jgi:pilus assembly protein CpaC